MDIRRNRDQWKEEWTDNKWKNQESYESKKRRKSVSPEKTSKKKKEETKKETRKQRIGSIYCICGIQTYEHGMLKCKICTRYSHAECYKKDDLSTEHVCGGCSVKNQTDCSNLEIQNFLKKINQNKEEKSQFVFKLAIRRVLNSILREEFKHTQPGIEPDEDFLKLKFGITSSYANKILVYLFKSGFISVTNGFKMNVEKIREYVNENTNDSGFVEKENSSYIDENEEIEFSLGSSNTGDEPKVESEKSKIPIELQNSPQPSGSRYKKKFLWPEKFLNRESRKESEPIEPIEPKDIGKQSVRPFFGQVMETLGPRLNSSEQKSWNLCVKLGRKGESIQVWSFGTENEIKSLDRILKTDSYVVYWGSYVISHKTSNNLQPTSDWIVKIQPKTSYLGEVKLIMSKTELSEDEEKTESKEKFSAKFQQPGRSAAKKRMKERKYEEKKKLSIDTDQRKITDFLQTEDDPLILNYETDSVEPCDSPIMERSSPSSQSSESPFYNPSPDGYLPDLSVSESESD